jgi:hypothetical protein
VNKRACVWRLLMIALICLALPSILYGQSAERVVQLSQYRAKSASEFEAVELVDIKVGELPVTMGRSFVAVDDWLSQLVLRVRNISGKPIISMRMAISFPEVTGAAGTLALILFDKEMSDKAITDTPKILMPGAETELRLTPFQYKQLRLTLSKKDIKRSLTKALLASSVVVRFDRSGELFCSYRYSQ